MFNLHLPWLEAISSHPVTCYLEEQTSKPSAITYEDVVARTEIHEVAEATNRLALFSVEYDEEDEIDSDFLYDSKNYDLTVCIPFWIQSAEYFSEY
ncbi:hypothetical protein DUI87_16611 [Hirundo rustica rustica]|uniref:Uncharacterized protein n=1 Tax=Hirundo rustica rustica TaxID=333673 RepID=A0A3M0K1Q9_HIRRU|nr:hypothetical protein DUI87_16611 [Hirundo rustica rustica]